MLVYQPRRGTLGRGIDREWPAAKTVDWVTRAASRRERARRKMRPGMVSPRQARSGDAVGGWEVRYFGNPADSESPVALRPRLATGLPFSVVWCEGTGGRCPVVPYKSSTDE